MALPQERGWESKQGFRREKGRIWGKEIESDKERRNHANRSCLVNFFFCLRKYQGSKETTRSGNQRNYTGQTHVKISKKYPSRGFEYV